MAYPATSDTLRKHRERLLQIAISHAKAEGLNGLKRERIAIEGGVSLGTVSNALGKRADMIRLVQTTARDSGIELSY